MTTQPTDTHAAQQISARTGRVLHDFVRDAVSRLSVETKDLVPEFEDVTRLERGSDGYFRELKKRKRTLRPMLSDDWLRSLPDYQTCIECLKSDTNVGPHLDHLVGTSMSASRFEVRHILNSLLHAMVGEDGFLTFTEARFQSAWLTWADFFYADRIESKMIAPLPYLVVPVFPLQLNKELVLDRLTDDEVTRCYQVGVIRLDSLQFPLIHGGVAVGIRRTTSLPKQIRRDGDPYELPNGSNGKSEGSFGNRPLFRDDLVVDDVLSALRLFKHAQIHTSGLASWSDSPLLKGGTSYRTLGRWPYHGNLELSEDDVPLFQELWGQLEEGAARFSFSIHRFNLAFDRGLLADRIVDLVIAAEALFLSDLGEKYRGELRYRFALRAAKFIGHKTYSEHDIFRIMRSAYDARSAIVHGGSPEKVSLPDNPSAELPSFVDVIEELIRLGLRKALSMKKDGKKMRESPYWDSLVFVSAPPDMNAMTDTDGGS